MREGYTVGKGKADGSSDYYRGYAIGWNDDHLRASDGNAPDLIEGFNDGHEDEQDEFERHFLRPGRVKL